MRIVATVPNCFGPKYGMRLRDDLKPSSSPPSCILLTEQRAAGLGNRPADPSEICTHTCFPCDVLATVEGAGLHSSYCTNQIH
jgi:hypothetical protein